MEKLSGNKVYITKFLKFLWDSPEIIHHILENSTNESVKTNLAYFVVNNLYCNVLTGNYMENNLFYLITMMLKDEIDKLDNINQVDIFLEDTKCGYLLEELRKMPDIQLFFNRVISKTVENIERNYSFREFRFKIDEIVKKINKEEKSNIKKKTNNILEDLYKKVINNEEIDNTTSPNLSLNGKKRNEFFVENYSPNLDIKVFETKAENAKTENKIDLYQYFKKLENEIKSSGMEKLFSNEVIMNNMLMEKQPDDYLAFYINDFLNVVSFLEQLFEDLKKNILLLPNSIKCICKVISLLIKKKFQNISKCEENAFISKFLIEKLLIPIISLPNFNALISDFIISRNTIKNISILNYILKKLFSGKLFLNNKDEGDYTPFNWLFINKMENIFYIFEKSTNVILPEFIEKYINDKMPKDYNYEFFKENKEQLCANISICFNLDNLKFLIEGIKLDNELFNQKEKKDNLFKLIISRLKKCIDEYNKLKEYNETKTSQKNLKKEKNKETEHDENRNIDYFIYNDMAIEEKYLILFSINNKIANFYIDIKKKEKTTKLDEQQKNIIKVKNYLCSSLGNYRLLNKSDFNIGTTINTLKLLNEIKLYMSLPNFILSNNNIPSVWYINSILDYLNKIPEEYKENDYKKLFEELTEDLNKSIDELDFEKLILFRNKLKFLDKTYNYYEGMKTLINTIITNENIKYIVEEAFIPVDMNFSYNEEKKIFLLNKSNIKDKLFENKFIYKGYKKSFISLKTIEAFTQYFPNLNEYQYSDNVCPIDIIKELSINDKIKEYFDMIKDRITKKNVIESKKYTTLYEEKLKNYVMNKIYGKIYPIEPIVTDVKIFQKTMNLSWVEPNIIIEKDYILDHMLPDILNEFAQLKKVKTPYKKLDCLKNILESITNLIKFNEGEDKEVGAEDIAPVLNYISIKAHPFRIYTDLEFIKLFIPENTNVLTFEQMFELILNSNEKSFNLTLEEFNKRCANAIKDIKDKEEYIYTFTL